MSYKKFGIRPELVERVKVKMKHTPTKERVKLLLADVSKQDLQDRSKVKRLVKSAANILKEPLTDTQEEQLTAFVLAQKKLIRKIPFTSSSYGGCSADLWSAFFYVRMIGPAQSFSSLKFMFMFIVPLSDFHCAHQPKCLCTFAAHFAHSFAAAVHPVTI